MKTLKIMPVEEILKLAEYKFTHIPEKFECDFDFEKKDCSIFVTFDNGTYTTICYVDWDNTKDRRKKYILENDIEYVVFVYDNEVYSNVNFNINKGIDYDSLEETLDKMHYEVYNKHYTNKYR